MAAPNKVSVVAEEAQTAMLVAPLASLDTNVKDRRGVLCTRRTKRLVTPVLEPSNI